MAKTTEIFWKVIYANHPKNNHVTHKSFVYYMDHNWSMNLWVWFFMAQKNEGFKNESVAVSNFNKNGCTRQLK